MGEGRAGKGMNSGLSSMIASEAKEGGTIGVTSSSITSGSVTVEIQEQRRKLDMNTNLMKNYFEMVLYR